MADKLYPLYIAQMEKVLSTEYIQVDQTTLPVVDRPGSARKAYVWAVRSVLSPGLFFHYDKGSLHRLMVFPNDIIKHRVATDTDGFSQHLVTFLIAFRFRQALRILKTGRVVGRTVADRDWRIPLWRVCMFQNDKAFYTCQKSHFHSYLKNLYLRKYSNIGL
jgi:hypothetical protein